MSATKSKQTRGFTDFPVQATARQSMLPEGSIRPIPKFPRHPETMSGKPTLHQALTSFPWTTRMCIQNLGISLSPVLGSPPNQALNHRISVMGSHGGQFPQILSNTVCPLHHFCCALKASMNHRCTHTCLQTLCVCKCMYTFSLPPSLPPLLSGLPCTPAPSPPPLMLFALYIPFTH